MLNGWRVWVWDFDFEFVYYCQRAVLCGVLLTYVDMDFFFVGG